MVVELLLVSSSLCSLSSSRPSRSSRVAAAAIRENSIFVYHHRHSLCRLRYRRLGLGTVVVKRLSTTIDRSSASSRLCIGLMGGRCVRVMCEMRGLHLRYYNTSRSSFWSAIARHRDARPAAKLIISECYVSHARSHGLGGGRQESGERDHRGREDREKDGEKGGNLIRELPFILPGDPVGKHLAEFTVLFGLAPSKLKCIFLLCPFWIWRRTRLI